jgi:hypothetical protein
MEDFILKAAKEFGLFAVLVGWMMWTNWKRENRLMEENQKREEKYISREEKYIDIVKTLSEEVKERLAKIETTLKRR